MYDEVIHKAFREVNKYHAGQFVHGTSVSMITHVSLTTATLLVSDDYEYFPTEVIVASLLHDVLERTNREPSDIVASFGATVSDHVDALTWRMYTGNHESDLIQNLSRILQTGPHVAAIKLASRIAHLSFPQPCLMAQQQETFKKDSLVIANALASAAPLLANELLDMIGD